MKRFFGPLCFVSFCFLIAFRDVLTDRLLTCKNCVHPTFLLLTWCIECAVLAWLVRSIRKKSFGFVKPFLQLERQQQLDFVKLGIATWIVYVVTINGIRALTAPVFNLFDYGTMPMLTLLTAYWINKERVYLQQVVGAIFSVCGILLLLSALIEHKSPVPNFQIWIALSFVSPLFTSVCSSLQRRQVDQNMTPDEVLLYRFPIPAVLMALWFCIDKVKETADAPINLGLSYLPAVLFIGAVTVFLPLWLLCYAFVRSSVGQLASYLFSIAVFTFVLAPLLVERSWDPTKLPAVLVSAVLLLIGYVIAEGLLRRRKLAQMVSAADISDSISTGSPESARLEQQPLGKRTKIFISYSHKDVKWFNRLRVHLKPLERSNEITRWDDTLIKPGEKWREAIKSGLEEARVAVLLISADFLASDFIDSNELPPLLASAESEGVVILPIVLSPSRFEKTTSLSVFQAVNAPSQPLNTMTRAKQEAVFVKVSEIIEDALRS